MIAGRMDQCRHCGHRRGGHRTQLRGLSTRVCVVTGACECTGFAPSHLTWDVFQTPGGWSVQSPNTGRVFDCLPDELAAVEVAQRLTDIDELLARINERVACAL